MFDGAFDANALLDFQYAGAITTLRTLFGSQARIVEGIRKREFSKGSSRGLADPCVDKGELWITVIDDLDTDEYLLSDELTLRLGEQHRGEAETIAVCFHRRLAFVSRDQTALKIAMGYGILVKSSMTILNDMIRSGALSYQEVVALAIAMQPRGINPADLLPERHWGTAR